jgi:hypothetical protein
MTPEQRKAEGQRRAKKREKNRTAVHAPAGVNGSAHAAA